MGGVTDKPEGSIDYGFLIVINRGNDAYDHRFAKLIWSSYNHNYFYINTCNGNVWSGWEGIATNSDLSL